jgi:peptide chain release factor 1
MVVVSLFPELEETKVVPAERDLRIEFTKGSGAGGQNRNKRSTAVRVTHLPTGISVFNCEEREQKQNRARALDILSEKLTALERERARNQVRSSQIHESGRSNKSRTFNFVHGFVMDHQTGVKTHKIDAVMNGHFELLD